MSTDESSIEKLHRIRASLAERIADSLVAGHQPAAANVNDYRDVCEQINRHNAELQAWIDDFMTSRRKEAHDD